MTVVCALACNKDGRPDATFSEPSTFHGNSADAVGGFRDLHWGASPTPDMTQTATWTADGVAFTTYERPGSNALGTVEFDKISLAFRNGAFYQVWCEASAMDAVNDRAPAVSMFERQLLTAFGDPTQVEVEAVGTTRTWTGDNASAVFANQEPPVWMLFVIQQGALVPKDFDSHPQPRALPR